MSGRRRLERAADAQRALEAALRVDLLFITALLYAFSACSLWAPWRTAGQI